MVSPVSTATPSQTKPAKRPARPASSASASIQTGAKADQFKSRKTTARFGGEQAQNSEKSGILGSVMSGTRKVGAGTLGMLSIGGAAIAVPLGLAQLALGIFIHPLLITGALTLGLPVVGGIASYLIWPKNK